MWGNISKARVERRSIGKSQKCGETRPKEGLCQLAQHVGGVAVRHVDRQPTSRAEH